eukprot:gene3363-6657_t
MSIKHLKYNDESIAIFCDNAVGIGGDKWPAAELFCSLISDTKWKDYFREQFSNKRCIEFGAGNGLVGIMIEKLFSPLEVIITDLDTHTPLIAQNIQLNNLSHSIAAPFDWTCQHQFGTFDIILVFECVYREDLYEDLIDSIDSVCRDNSTIYFGLTRSFCKPEFFDMLLRKGFNYTMIPHDATSKSNQNISDETAIFVLKHVHLDISVDQGNLLPTVASTFILCTIIFKTKSPSSRFPHLKATAVNQPASHRTNNLSTSLATINSTIEVPTVNISRHTGCFNTFKGRLLPPTDPLTRLLNQLCSSLKTAPLRNPDDIKLLPESPLKSHIHYQTQEQHISTQVNFARNSFSVHTLIFSPSVAVGSGLVIASEQGDPLVFVIVSECFGGAGRSCDYSCRELKLCVLQNKDASSNNYDGLLWKHIEEINKPSSERSAKYSLLGCSSELTKQMELIRPTARHQIGTVAYLT